MDIKPILYILLVAVLLMCGCATDNDWMGTSEDYRHSYLVADDPSTWRPYHNYRQYECEICHRTKDKVSIHWAHEKPQCDFPELINDPDNGHTLCRDCHWFFHYQNTTRFYCDNMDEIIEVINANKREYKKHSATK